MERSHLDNAFFMQNSCVFRLHFGRTYRSLATFTLQVLPGLQSTAAAPSFWMGCFTRAQLQHNMGQCRVKALPNNVFEFRFTPPPLPRRNCFHNSADCAMRTAHLAHLRYPFFFIWRTEEMRSDFSIAIGAFLLRSDVCTRITLNIGMFWLFSWVKRTKSTWNVNSLQLKNLRFGLPALSCAFLLLKCEWVLIFFSSQPQDVC